MGYLSIPFSAENNRKVYEDNHTSKPDWIRLINYKHRFGYISEILRWEYFLIQKDTGFSSFHFSEDSLLQGSASKTKMHLILWQSVIENENYLETMIGKIWPYECQV